MSAQMTAPFSRVYGDETQKAPPAMEAPERDSKFQNFMSKLVDSLHESDVSSRDSKKSEREKSEEFDAMNTFAGRQMKDDSERVIHHQQAPAMAVAATAAQPNPHAARDMNALLKTEQASTPIDGPKNTNDFAKNAETASKGADNKAVAAERGEKALISKANDIATRMSPQDIAGMQPKGDNLAGPVAEAAIHMANPKLGMAVMAAAVVSTGQGQGTYSTEKTASKSVLSKSEQRAQAKAPSYYYDQAPQAIAAPSQSTNTAQFFDKMGQGPGFGTGKDLTARSALAAQNLGDLKIDNIRNAVEGSQAMKSIKVAGIDADKTKNALQDMEGKGLVANGGKQTVKEELQAFVKPTASSPPGFRA